MVAKINQNRKERKPKGYWKKWENIESELRLIIKKIGHFPTVIELRDLKRSDLLTGIGSYHGGLNMVRNKMGFEYKKKPKGYWKKWENIKRELKLIIKKIGHFSTDIELRNLKKSDLLQGISSYHGGLNNVRNKMGFEYKRKTNGYWKKWENIERELKLIIKKIGHFPIETELRDLNKYDLLGGIKRYYGGLNKVRNKMGFEYKKKPNGYWKKWENIKRELKIIIKKIGHFPTDSELQELRKFDLLGGIETYHSNLIAVRKKMGYKLDDLCKRASYHAKRGYNTQKYVLEILKNYADVRGITYSQKKETMVGPGHFLELICDKNNLIGVDITNAKHERTVTRKWEEKKYHSFVDIFWIIVISDKWDDEQYEKWNEESPENIIVIDGRKLEEFLNSIGMDNETFEIPKSKKQKLDALARCTFWNKERVKKEYEFLTKQRKIDNFYT